MVLDYCATPATLATFQVFQCQVVLCLRDFTHAVFSACNSLQIVCVSNFELSYNVISSKGTFLTSFLEKVLECLLSVPDT